MEIEYVMDEKDDAEIRMDNATIAEILRVELAKDSDVKFVAWKRNQPGTPALLAVKTDKKTVRKAIKDASISIEKNLDSFLKDFKKSK